MKAILLASIFLVTSCSLIEKRKSHYSYIKPGISLEEVKAKSGEPIYESFNDNETVLTYDYCAAPYWKEAVGGVLTFTMYNWHCNMNLVKVNLFFRDGVLYGMQDNTNAEERAAAARAMANAFDGVGKGLERQQQNNIQQNQFLQQRPTTRCTSRQMGGAVFTDCN